MCKEGGLALGREAGKFLIMVTERIKTQGFWKVAWKWKYLVNSVDTLNRQGHPPLLRVIMITDMGTKKSDIGVHFPE